MRSYKLMEWTDDRVKRFWDYESNYPENYFAFQAGASVIHELKRYFKNAKSALDFGAGPGFLIPHLIAAGLEVTALEFSDDSVKKLKDKFKGKPGFKDVAQPEELLSKKAKFDLIMVTEVIEHLNDYYLDKSLLLIKDLLSPSGVVIFTTPNNEDLSKLMIYNPVTDEIFHRWQHVRSWNVNSLRIKLEEYNFHVVDVIETQFLIHFNPRVSIYTKVKTKVKWLIKRILLGKIARPNLVAIASLKG